MAGLVTGPRVRPAVEMVGYVRNAAERLHAVTGRAPSQAFYDSMESPESHRLRTASRCRPCRHEGRAR